MTNECRSPKSEPECPHRELVLCFELRISFVIRHLAFLRLLPRIKPRLFGQLFPKLPLRFTDTARYFDPRHHDQIAVDAIASWQTPSAHAQLLTVLRPG